MGSRRGAREPDPHLTSGPKRTPDLLIVEWKATDRQPEQNTKEVEEMKVRLAHGSGPHDAAGKETSGKKRKREKNLGPCREWETIYI